jgi:hypothetical protein
MTGTPETVLWIVTPYCCAGIVARDGKVVEAAPIFRYMIGWDGRRVADYCYRKGWSWEIAPTRGPVVASGRS